MRVETYNIKHHLISMMKDEDQKNAKYTKRLDRIVHGCEADSYSSLNNMEVEPPNWTRPTTTSDYFYIVQPWYINIKSLIVELLPTSCYLHYLNHCTHRSCNTTGFTPQRSICVQQSRQRVYIGAFDLDDHRTISPLIWDSRAPLIVSCMYPWTLYYICCII